ncbi:MAG: response regulator [Verrucomicrobiota bacterium]
MYFLIVDDDPRLGQLLDFYLRTMGHECDVISNAIEVEPCLHHQFYDAMILDLMMPQINGLTLIPAIKIIAPELPIIIFTAAGINDDMMRAALSAGASGYVSKTLGPGDVYIAVMRAISNPVQNGKKTWSIP